MKGILGIVLTLSAYGVCAAQSTELKSTAAKQYRLTMVLANPQNQGPSQRFVFDVPVTAEHPGQAEMNLTAGPAGQADNGTKQSLKCTSVHASQAGLAAKVSYSVDSVSPEPMPGSTEHLISHFVFEKQIDVPLGEPTEITDVNSLKPLNGDQAPRPAPLQITITATAL